MSIKDTLIDEQVKRDQNTDLSYEHETHTEGVKNCYECYCEGKVEKEEKPDCDFCGDTGFIEIMGGTDYDEWTVVDVKPCRNCNDPQD